MTGVKGMILIRDFIGWWFSHSINFFSAIFSSLWLLASGRKRRKGVGIFSPPYVGRNGVVGVSNPETTAGDSQGMKRESIRAATPVSVVNCANHPYGNPHGSLLRLIKVRGACVIIKLKEMYISFSLSLFLPSTKHQL